MSYDHLYVAIIDVSAHFKMLKNYSLPVLGCFELVEIKSVVCTIIFTYSCTFAH